MCVSVATQHKVASFLVKTPQQKKTKPITTKGITDMLAGGWGENSEQFTCIKYNFSRMKAKIKMWKSEEESFFRSNPSFV